MRSFLGAVAAVSLVGALTSSASNTEAYERWLRIHNDTSFELCYVYISHVGTSDWGPDILGPCLAPGRFRTVDPGWQQGYCKVDMKFVFDDGDEVTEWDFNICEGTDFTIY